MQAPTRTYLKQQSTGIPSSRHVCQKTVSNRLRSRARSRSRAGVVNSTTGPLLPLLAPHSPNKATTRILPLLSELVEIQALTAKFETLAGRSAMIAFAVAATAESLLPHSGLFGNWQEAISFSVLVVTLVIGSSLAAVVATNTKIRRNLGLRLLEPILVSLTSRSRSAGAVTGRDVDRVLDFTMDMVFDARFMNTVFSLEAEDPYI